MWRRFTRNWPQVIYSMQYVGFTALLCVCHSNSYCHLLSQSYGHHFTFQGTGNTQYNRAAENRMVLDKDQKICLQIRQSWAILNTARTTYNVTIYSAGPETIICSILTHVYLPIEVDVYTYRLCGRQKISQASMAVSTPLNERERARGWAKFY